MNKEEITVNKVELKMKYFKKSEMENYLNQLFTIERKNTTQIIEALTEVARRRMYLEFNQTSLFGLLTKHFGYPPATAQVWVENVRMMIAVPEIKEDLKSGELHTSQISLVAKAIREKKKEAPEVKIETRKLLNQVKNQTVAETQVTLARTLDLEIKQLEKKKIQKDESVRLELTLCKEQMQELEKVKEIFAHVYPHLTIAELISVMAKDIIKRKDPAAPKGVYIKRQQIAEVEPQTISKQTAMMNKELRNNEQSLQRNPTSETEYAAQNKSIPAQIKRSIHQRDQSCQHPGCGSKFQLQIDHKKPIWAGGGNETENLQLLCAQHNRLKYRNEANLK